MAGGEWVFALGLTLFARISHGKSCGSRQRPALCLRLLNQPRRRLIRSQLCARWSVARRLVIARDDLAFAPDYRLRPRDTHGAAQARRRRPSQPLCGGAAAGRAQLGRRQSRKRLGSPDEIAMRSDAPAPVTMSATRRPLRNCRRFGKAAPTARGSRCSRLTAPVRIGIRLRKFQRPPVNALTGTGFEGMPLSVRRITT